MNTSTEAEGRLIGANDYVSLLVAGHGTCGVQIEGTWVGTITFEVLINGVTWQAINLTPTNSTTATSTATSNGIFVGGIAGMKTFRARLSSFTSGIATVAVFAVGTGGGSGSGGGGGSGATTIADGADVAEGSTTDAAVTGDNSGTVNAHLRGIDKILADVWDSVNHWVKVGLAAGSAIIGSVKDAGYQNATWAVHHLPAVNTVATITQASAGGSLKNVCLSFAATIAASSVAPPAAIQLSVALIDGATGGGTYLWRSVVSLPAIPGAVVPFVPPPPPHGWEGTAATAMTLEFSVAGGALTVESVSMYGTTRL